MGSSRSVFPVAALLLSGAMLGAAVTLFWMSPSTGIAEPGSETVASESGPNTPAPPPQEPVGSEMDSQSDVEFTETQNESERALYQDVLRTTSNVSLLQDYIARVNRRELPGVYRLSVEMRIVELTPAVDNLHTADDLRVPPPELEDVRTADHDLALDPPAEETPTQVEKVEPNRLLGHLVGYWKGERRLRSPDGDGSRLRLCYGLNIQRGENSDEVFARFQERRGRPPLSWSDCSQVPTIVDFARWRASEILNQVARSEDRQVSAPSLNPAVFRFAELDLQVGESGSLDGMVRAAGTQEGDSTGLTEEMKIAADLSEIHFDFESGVLHLKIDWRDGSPTRVVELEKL